MRLRRLDDLLRDLRHAFRSLRRAPVVLGLGGALALQRVLSGMLYGVEPTDPATLAGVSLLMGAAAMLAALLPARRATRVDPMEALRAE